MEQQRAPAGCPNPGSDRRPFDIVRYRRAWTDGELTDEFLIEGFDAQGRHEIRVPVSMFWSRAEQHLQEFHGKNFDQTEMPEEFKHAATRVAVDFLLGCLTLAILGVHGGWSGWQRS
ncbi:MAG: hypothetical protein NVS2B16_12780 [Chloroflexota bacterium]